MYPTTGIEFNQINSTMYPQASIDQLESNPTLPDGTGDRFRGYGIVGLPFASGHLLAFRRFPASSLGPGYSAVWHRDPAGVWTFYADVDPDISCYLYFGNEVKNAVLAPIDVRWKSPRQLRIAVQQAGLVLDVELSSTRVTRWINRISPVLPDRVWKNSVLLRWMARIVGGLLGLGVVRLSGQTSNGHAFLANPQQLWVIHRCTAWLNGHSLGLPGPLPAQVRLGDFYLPRRGLFMLGQVYFTGPEARASNRKRSPAFARPRPV